MCMCIKILTASSISTKPDRAPRQWHSLAARTWHFSVGLGCCQAIFSSFSYQEYLVHMYHQSFPSNPSSFKYVQSVRLSTCIQIGRVANVLVLVYMSCGDWVKIANVVRSLSGNDRQHAQRFASQPLLLNYHRLTHSLMHHHILLQFASNNACSLIYAYTYF